MTRLSVLCDHSWYVHNNSPKQYNKDCNNICKCYQHYQQMFLYWSEWNKMFYLNDLFHILLVLVLYFLWTTLVWKGSSFLKFCLSQPFVLTEQIVYTQILELGVLPKLDENYIMFTSFKYFSAFCIKLASLLNCYKNNVRDMFKFGSMAKTFHAHCSDEIIDK